MLVIIMLQAGFQSPMWAVGRRCGNFGAVARNVTWEDRIPKLLFRGGRTSEERKVSH